MSFKMKKKEKSVTRPTIVRLGTMEMYEDEVQYLSESSMEVDDSPSDTELHNVDQLGNHGYQVENGTALPYLSPSPSSSSPSCNCGISADVKHGVGDRAGREIQSVECPYGPQVGDSSSPSFDARSQGRIMRDPLISQQNKNFSHPVKPRSDQNLNPCRRDDDNKGSSPALLNWRVVELKRSQNLDKQIRNSAHLRNSLHWEEFFGSSLDLTPTLLGIYDQIASASSKSDNPDGPHSQFEGTQVTRDTHEEDSENCNISKSIDSLHPNVGAKMSSDSAYSSECCSLKKSNVHVDWDISTERGSCSNRVRTDSGDSKMIADNENDNKKRPLSISSMSSSSTSSLPRHRKRPNLCEYSDTSSSGLLDIEKLDNIQFIDDVPSGNTDDESSGDQVSKRKSGGDSDSQISTEHASYIGDQSSDFHQSDTSLSYTPSSSAQASNVDLSQTLVKDVEDEKTKINAQRASSQEARVTSPPSRASLKSSIGISRSSSSSLKQATHYISHVQRVVAEIVDTERIYVKNLQDIRVGYYQYLVSQPDISRDERNCLFSNINEILDFSCDFLAQLEECGQDPVKVAECFVRNNEGFRIYAEYCTNYPSAVAVLTKVMRVPYLSELFKERQVLMGHSLPLGSYLLKPVQRILKYHLLLQNILKHYNKSEPGYKKLEAALNHTTGMAHHINEMKRKHEHAIRVQEIQSQLEDYDGEDFTQLGELVLEGSFRMYGAKASRQMFLFKRGVIIAKRKEDGMLSCKTFIPCATLMLVESIAKEPLNFQILPFDNPRGAHTIHARNLDQKRKWCQEMKRLILESYSSKIPDNVKEMVLQQLGKSKEEEDYQHVVGSRDAEPGKSHVTTPDYLEKRQKMRRKSGGAFIPDILKGRRMQLIGRKSETPSPKSESNLHRLQEKARKYNSNEQMPHSGRSVDSPSSTLLRKSNTRNPSIKRTDQSPPTQKRPVSIQRSQSFQHATNRSPRQSEDFTSDSNILESVAQSETHPVRTRSFRMATRLSPLQLDDEEENQTNGHRSNVGESPVLDRVLKERNRDNVFYKGHQNVGDVHTNKMSGRKDVNRNSSSFRDMLNVIDNRENLQCSDGLGKRGRYASMPVLSSEPLASPKMSRLSSERSAQSPTINHNSISKSSLSTTKQIDLKPYFNWNKDRLNQLSSSNSMLDDQSAPKNLSRDTKTVRAFHDVFQTIRKSSENLNGKQALPQKTLTLTQPKTFTSALRQSGMLGSHAKLNKWERNETFTKGSLADVSHLQEDPWIRGIDDPQPEKKVASPLPNDGVLCAEKTGKHSRTHSFNETDHSFSKDNFDWLVYANRNSLPVAGFQPEEQDRHYKYCTPPRGSMEPPGHSADDSFHSRRNRIDSNNTDSSASLSATTSSETCSSPDILKDAIFDESSSAEKIIPHANTGPHQVHSRGSLSRSFSSPDSKRSHRFHKETAEERPASMDILSDVKHIEDSEKLLKEMECYMMQSSSSSSSLSSNKFPTCIPHFDHSNKKQVANRDSCTSTGSSSSYESTSHDMSSVSHLEQSSDEKLVHNIKHKLHNITNKLTGKKSSSFEIEHEEYDNSPPASPIKYRSEDGTSKPSPLSHQFSLRSKNEHHKAPEHSLPSLLRESEPGSRVIGSRMANPEFDDYAHFATSRSSPSKSQDKLDGVSPLQPHSPAQTTIAEHDTSRSERNLSFRKPNSDPKHMSLPPQYSAGSSTPNLNSQEADSAFSIQSLEIDSSTPEDSPRDGETATTDKESKQTEGVDVPDTFYEKRLSTALSEDEAFRDSAVYCDTDVECPSSPVLVPRLEPIPKVPIKEYVQKLEEKGKVSVPSPMKVRQREPGAIIKQRMESLQAKAEYRKSSSTSRSISLTNSRSQSQCTSRCSSRAVSEDRELLGDTSSALKEYIDLKFPMDGISRASAMEEKDGSRSRSATPQRGTLKHAYSLGRLDQLSSTDVDSLVVMKGWVRQLIGKFQVES